MKNQFEDAMSKRTDEDLQKIIGSQADHYHPEAVKAAEQEIKKREFFRDELSKYSDEQILEILISGKNYQQFEIAAEEAKKRNLNFNYEEVKAETVINEEIKKLKIDVVN